MKTLTQTIKRTTKSLSAPESVKGLLHQKLDHVCRYSARHYAHGRGETGCEAPCGSLRAAAVYHHQYERLCCLHTRHVALRDAAGRNTPDAFPDTTVGTRLGCICCGQCRGTDGVLLPHLLADVGHRSSCSGTWHHTAHIYHNRHGRNR